MIFTVSLPGYEHWADTMTKKPSDFEETVHVKLKRLMPEVASDPSTRTVAFDKIVSIRKNGDPVGTIVAKKGDTTPNNWDENRAYSRTAIATRFHDKLDGIGLPTPLLHERQLFDMDSRQRAPGFLVGVELQNYREDLYHQSGESNGAGKVIVRQQATTMWKVYDVRKKRVVLAIPVESVIKRRQKGWDTLGEFDVVFDDALAGLLGNAQFQSLMQASNSAPAMQVSDTIRISPGDPIPSGRAAMIDRSERSCVTVLTDDGHGSGVIIDPEGYVLSAYHVVHGATHIEVLFSNGLRQNASIIVSDPESDMVLLDISGSGYAPAPVLTGGDVRQGDDVITIGTPADPLLGQSISKGVVSGKRKIDELDYIQTDLAVNPGNSGGPLFNERGEVIGIIVSKLVGRGIEGLGFAVPIDQALGVLRIKVE